MPTAKDIRVAPISATDARRTIKRLHYSGKVANNSQLHLGVFLNGKIEGALQLGPSLDKRKLQGLVEGTGWNEFIELNRLAFSEELPRNSESRALAVAFRIIKKNYPHLKWIVSFADATQCGDGTIYRASGFILTQIKKNTSIWEINGQKFTDVGYRTGANQRLIISKTTATKGKHINRTGSASMKYLVEAGAKPLKGFQLRYIYFLDKSYRDRLTVPELPFSAIQEAGAGMYKGQKR